LKRGVTGVSNYGDARIMRASIIRSKAFEEFFDSLNVKWTP